MAARLGPALLARRRRMPCGEAPGTRPARRAIWSRPACAARRAPANRRARLTRANLATRSAIANAPPEIAWAGGEQTRAPLAARQRCLLVVSRSASARAKAFSRRRSLDGLLAEPTRLGRGP